MPVNVAVAAAFYRHYCCQKGRVRLPAASLINLQERRRSEGSTRIGVKNVGYKEASGTVNRCCEPKRGDHPFSLSFISIVSLVVSCGIVAGNSGGDKRGTVAIFAALSRQKGDSRQHEKGPEGRESYRGRAFSSSFTSIVSLVVSCGSVAGIGG